MDPDNVLLVLVRCAGQSMWFRSEPEYWVLDYIKWGEAFVAAGYGDDSSDSCSRMGIWVVDQNNAEVFLSKMSQFVVEEALLREEFALIYDDAEDWLDIAEYLPSVFVDFDSMRLWSIHPEPPRFELWVPDGWEGLHEDFFGEVPPENAYWTAEGRSRLDRFS
jgi:hypothetical protein